MTSLAETGALRAAELDDFRVLAISGDDRYDFLQGQLTQDVGRVDTGHSALAGWASAKGRLLAVGQLIATPDTLLWPLPADVADGVQRRLGMFVLRANARVSILDYAVVGLCGLNPDEELDIGGIELGTDAGAAADAADVVAARLVGDASRAWLSGPADAIRTWRDAAGCGTTDDAEWRLLDIRAGLPVVVAATSESFIPQMLNLDLLDAISFTKGCYVGQEIVARTQNLGRIKRRMYRFRAAGHDDLEPGATIYGPENATGKVVAVAQAGDHVELTAVIAIDQSGENWFADTSKALTLEALPLPYAV